jgi:hypothetical protein
MIGDRWENAKYPKQPADRRSDTPQIVPEDFCSPIA